MSRLVALLLASAVAGVAAAQPLEIPLGTGAGDQWNSTACTDGQGGAFIAWLDRRDGLQTDIRLQRVDAAGDVAPGWPLDGFPVCDARGDQTAPCVAGDGSGGVFIAWEDRRGGDADLRIQRLTAAGAPAAGWPRNGLVLCAAPGPQLEPVVTTDQQGGIYAAWSDYRTGLARVHAQHVTPAGNDPAWPMDGWRVCEGAGAQRSPAIASDGRGGALLAWQDTRSGSAGLYAALFNAARDRPWGSGGRVLCTAPGEQRRVRAAANGAGGGYFVWEDTRGADFDLYGLRVAESGDLEFPWAEDGLPLCAASGGQFEPQLEPDGAGGALLAWFDARSGAGFDVYALRINARAEARPGWRTGGTPVCGATGDQVQPVLAGDGRGGAWIAWADRRAGSADIALQHLDGTGTPSSCWPEDGVVIASAAHDQEHPALVAGPATAVCAWTDLRSNTDGDVYARRVHESLTSGPVDPNGVAVCIQPGTQELGPVSAPAQAAVSDGAGGAWIVWQDGRNASAAPDLYIQHLGADARPAPGWPADGVPLCTAPGPKQAAVLSPDGAGGCVAAWSDARAGAGGWRVYVQRLDALGQVASGWAAGGMRVTDGAAGQWAPALAVDVQGRAWVVWQEQSPGGFEIVLQATAPAGSSAQLFPGQGLTLCNAPGEQVEPRAVAATDGVTVVWRDGRNGSDTDLYGIGVGSNGTRRSGWIANGNVLCGAPRDQFDAILAADGAAGVWLAWRDRRHGRDEIFGRRVLESGAAAPGWPVGGLVLSGAGDARDLRLVPDGAGGVIVAWRSQGTGLPHIELARRTAEGEVPPGFGPVPLVLSGAGAAFTPSLAADGHGGALVAWCDARETPAIYAQRVRVDGVLEGADGGQRLCAPDAVQRTPALVADGGGCGLAVWSDRRAGGADLYANPVRIWPVGAALRRVPGAVAPRSGPRNAAARAVAIAHGVQLQFDRPPAGAIQVRVFDVRGRCIDAWAAAGREGRCDLRWTRGRPPGAGTYLVQIQSANAAWHTKLTYR